MGDPVKAVDNYQDIPLETRNALKSAIAKKAYSAFIEIKRDSLGDGLFEPEITQMHFGKNKLCMTVDRSKWSPTAVERGMVFCADGYCLLLPTVCGNLSRIKPVPVKSLQPLEPSAGGSALGFLPSPLPRSFLESPLPDNLVEIPELEIKLNPMITPPSTFEQRWTPFLEPPINYYNYPRVVEIPEPKSIFLAALGVLVVLSLSKKK